jgi:hypothetical protein
LSLLEGFLPQFWEQMDTSVSKTSYSIFFSLEALKFTISASPLNRAAPAPLLARCIGSDEYTPITRTHPNRAGECEHMQKDEEHIWKAL